MLKPRLVIAALLLLVFGGMLTSIVMLLLPPSPRRLAVDSYSGRRIGHRAVLELLQALGVKARRNLSTPAELFNGSGRVVLLQPEIRRLELEKAYLEQIAYWVESGGELLVVSDTLTVRRQHQEDEQLDQSKSKNDKSEKDTSDKSHCDKNACAGRSGEKSGLLDELDLKDLKIVGDTDEEPEQENVKIFRRRFEYYKQPRERFKVRASGSLEDLSQIIQWLMLPESGPRYFSGQSISKAKGLLEIAVGKNQWRPVVLQFEHGSGSITMASTPCVFTNLGVGKEDNSVLAYHLAAGKGKREVVVDEYYHGAMVQGSSLVLLTIPVYALIVLCILLAASIWAWLYSVRFGPPISETNAKRRSIVEYIDAMARLFRRGKKHRFVLSNCRDGLIGDLQTELYFSPATAEKLVLNRLAQLNPEREKQVRRVLDLVDSSIASSRRITLSRLIKLQEMLDQCRIPNQKK